MRLGPVGRGLHDLDLPIDDDEEPVGRVTFTDDDLTGPKIPDLAEQGEIEHTAQFYAFGNVGDIAIPAGGTQRITSTCAFPLGGTVVTATPHMHSMGRGFELSRHDGTAVAEPLIAEEGWLNPRTETFSPPLELSSGEGFTFSCEWASTKSTPTYFGESSDHEMCFVFGFYYPADFELYGVDGFGCDVDENVITPG